VRALVLLALPLALACGDTVADLVVSGAGGQPGVCEEAACPPATPFCDAASGACVGCRSSVDCTQDEALVCHPTRRECVQCLDDLYCGEPGETCNVALGRCALPCTEQADCALDPETACSTTLGICVECSTDADCPDPGERCVRAECTGGDES
jgi:hypothetical protein